MKTSRLLAALLGGFLLLLGHGIQAQAATAPLGLLPENGDTQVITLVDTGQVVFTWSKVPGAVRYRLSISQEDSTFSQPRIYSVTDTNCLAVMRAGLKTWDWGKWYFWKVAAIAADSNFAESPIYSFAMAGFDVRAPVMFAKSGSVPVPVSLDMEYWLFGFSRHFLELSQDPEFKNLSDTVSASLGLSPPGYYNGFLSLNLKHSTTYYCRMFAGEREWTGKPIRMTGPSTVIAFTTAPLLRAPPMLDSPADGASVPYNSVVFKVHKPLDADRLTLEISANDFADPPAVSASVDIRHASSRVFGFNSGSSLHEFLIKGQLAKFSDFYWRVRSTFKGETLGLSPSRKGWADKVGGSPTPEFPASGHLIYPDLARFEWRRLPIQVPYATRFNLRIEDRDPPNAVVFDTVLADKPVFQVDDGYRLGALNSGILKPGMSYQWAVRMGVDDQWGPFSARIPFQTLSLPEGTSLCAKMNGIGPTKHWRYQHRLYSGDYTSAVLEFSTENVRRRGDSLLFTLHGKKDDAILPPNSYVYKGCALSWLDPFQQEWLPMDFQRKSRLEAYWSATDMTQLFLDDSLLYSGVSHFAWRTYRGNTLLEANMSSFAHPTGGTGSGGIRAKGRFLEGVGLVSWEASSSLRTEGLRGNAREYLFLIAQDGVPFDTTQILLGTDPTLGVHAAKIPARPPVAFTSLRQLNLDKSWTRARLYSPQGSLIADFSPAKPVDPGSLPDGLYFLQLETQKRKNLFKVIL